MIKDVTVALLMSKSDIRSNNPNNQETSEIDISFICFVRREARRVVNLLSAKGASCGEPVERQRRVVW